MVLDTAVRLEDPLIMVRHKDVIEMKRGHNPLITH